MNLKITNTFVLVLYLFFMLSGCQSDTKKLLCRRWKTVSLKNSKMENEIQASKDYIDTIGKNDPELRSAINLDSAKFILQTQIAESIKEQRLAEDNTFMEFKSNGVAYTTSTEGTDSAMYSLEDHFIKIDEAKLKGYGETMTFEILKLNEDSLKLRVIDYGDTSLVTLIPIKP